MSKSTKKESAQQRAKLRICASCEWVFHISTAKDGGCPKCGFAHYGARWVHGNKAYQYRYSQRPWVYQKMDRFLSELNEEIRKTVQPEERHRIPARDLVILDIIGDAS